MKKLISCFSLALCILLGTVFLTACGSSTKYLRPEFKFEGNELTVKLVTNEEKDFEFPIEGQKFDHSKLVNENIFQYTWVIYNGDDIVGWIELGSSGYDGNVKKGYKYGFATSINNGVYGYSNTHFVLILKSTDLTIFDRIEVKSDCCSVAILTEIDENPQMASKRYFTYDEETNQSVPAAGSEKFVCGFYALDLESIDPSKTQNIIITFSFKSE